MGPPNLSHQRLVPKPMLPNSYTRCIILHEHYLEEYKWNLNLNLNLKKNCLKDPKHYSQGHCKWNTTMLQLWKSSICWHHSTTRNHWTAKQVHNAACNQELWTGHQSSPATNCLLQGALFLPNCTATNYGLTRLVHELSQAVEEVDVIQVPGYLQAVAPLKLVVHLRVSMPCNPIATCIKHALFGLRVRLKLKFNSMTTG